ncbi:MAG: tryptophan synthase subunit alpha [Pseudomonadota bacterium]
MSQRIEEKFTELKAKNQKALITFIMGGDPDLAKSAEILKSLPAAGADIIEVGMPFSDPMADGATIEAAGLRALSAGVKLKNIIDLIKDFRKSDDKTPVILMGYYNPIYRYGVEKFCVDAKNSGIDGVIIVDLPPEEEDEFISVAKNFDIKLIRLVAPTTDDIRFEKLIKNSGGFIYYISIAGITGTKSADINELEARVKHLKNKTKLPIAVGFGIKTPEQAKEVAKFADAVVVGSALVDIIAKESPEKAVEFVRRLKLAIDSIK